MQGILLVNCPNILAKDGQGLSLEVIIKSFLLMAKALLVAQIVNKRAIGHIGIKEQ